MKKISLNAKWFVKNKNTPKFADNPKTELLLRGPVISQGIKTHLLNLTLRSF